MDGKTKRELLLTERNSNYLRITLQKMNEKEIKEMQRKIDLGILVAQQRLIERTKRFDGTLILAKDGEVVEVPAKDL